MQHVLEAHWLASDIAFGVFVVGCAVLAVLISRENRFGVLDTALCMAGLKKYKRNIPIAICLVLTIGGPLFIMVWAISRG